VHAILIQLGIKLPAALDVPKEQVTVFHVYSPADQLHPDVPEILYSAGFTDVDGQDAAGRTPLMLFQNITLNYVEWLINHGADPCRNIPTRSNLRLACLLSEWITLIQQDETSFDRESLGETLFGDRLSLQSQLIALNSSDDCKCPCSVNGCQPITSALKSLRNDGCPGSEQPTQILLCVLRYLYDQPKFQEMLRHDLWLVQCILRYITFEDLGIMHVCCSYSATMRDWRTYNDEEVTEILEEESYRIDMLEELVAEFEAAYLDLKLPLPDFLDVYWMKRMRTISQQEQMLKEEEVNRFIKIGIVPQ
jgi:hypothetical protein